MKKVLISGGGGKFANQLVQSNTIIVLSLLDKTGIINLGGPPQTIYAFVKDKKPEIGAIYLKDIDDVYMPTDTTLNITKMKRLLEHE